MTREEILNKANELVNGDRAKIYGDAFENHGRIAALWSVVLDRDVSVAEVYQCMILVKISRLMNTPDSIDSWVDIAGYASLGGELNEERE